jgi:catalase
MSRKTQSKYVIASLFGLAASWAIAADEAVTPDRAVSALEGTFGSHQGERRNHIKGTCAVGNFVGRKEGARYSRSALFSGKPVPVVARFSLAGGNPKAPDTAKSPRGMALEFRLPKGNIQHMTMLNVPIFGAMSPQTFVDSIVAARPDPATGKPDPEALKAFRAGHPDSQMLAQFLEQNNPPASFASSAYFGIHTFKFIDKKNKTTLVRWQFVPQDGEKRLSDDEMKTAGANFLEAALISRVQQGPARWDMVLTIGEPGDPEDNPTLAWPDARKKVVVGTLSIKAAMPQKGAECEPINFDPLVMADGIAPTNDPILLFRSPAYAVSFGKRQGGT